jgi:hypothetical protein
MLLSIYVHTEAEKAAKVSEGFLNVGRSSVSDVHMSHGRKNPASFTVLRPRTIRGSLAIKL